MSKALIVVTLIAVAIIAVVSVRNLAGHNNEQETKPITDMIASTIVSEGIEEIVTKQIQSMSLDEKIGQMLIVGVNGYYPDEHIQNMITKHHVGGVNLLKRNIENKVQLKKLTTDLYMMTEIPLLIAVDQEGGDINRINFLEENIPQYEIQSIEQAEQVATARAKELQILGITVNFSPILDYVSNPNSYLYNRTFKKDPETTATLGSAMVRGYLQGGIMPVPKHFPGYGNAPLDPHTSEATFSLEQDELEEYLLPFREVLREHPTIPLMVAHIIIPIVDTKPATRSAVFLSDILREQIGFEGVIITDDIEMASVGEEVGKAAVEAITAGVDIIIATKTPEKQIEVLSNLKEAAQNGTLTEERINQSVRRILTLKKQL